MTYPKTVTWVALLMVGTAGAKATAQEGPDNRTLTFDLTAVISGSSETDFDDGGTLGISRYWLEGEMTRHISARRSIGLSLGAGRSTYDFGDGFAHSRDLDIDELALAVPIRFAVGERSGGFVAPFIGFAGQTHVDFDDGASYGALGGVAWQLSPDLRIGPGLGLQYSLRDEWDLFPFFVLDWKLNDRFSLGTGSDMAGSRGPGLRLEYKPRADWTLGIEARYDAFEFRLADDHATPGGIGIDRSIPVALTASWRADDRVQISGFVGAALAGALEFEDTDGHTDSRSDYDPAPFFGISAKFSF